MLMYISASNLSGAYIKTVIIYALILRLVYVPETAQWIQ